MKKLLSLFLFLALLSSNAFAQNSQNAPITQLQNGAPAQAGDQVHIARCNYAGCDYRVTLGSIAGLNGGGYANEQIVASGTTATVAQVGTFVIVNSPAPGAKTITIPAPPGSKKVITIQDYAGTAYGNSITAVPVSGGINGLNQVYTNFGSISLYDSSVGWISF